MNTKEVVVYVQIAGRGMETGLVYSTPVGVDLSTQS